MQNLATSGRVLRPSGDDFAEHLGGNGGSKQKTDFEGEVVAIASPIAPEPNTLAVLGSGSKKMVLCRRSQDGWKVVATEDHPDQLNQELDLVSLMLDDGTPLLPVSEDTASFIERCRRLLLLQSLNVNLASPNATPLNEYMDYIFQDRQSNFSLKMALARGLELLNTVEGCLYSGDSFAACMEKQRDFLATLPKNDFLLYRAYRAGSDMALASLIRNGMGLFDNNATRQKWLRLLRKYIPIWENAAISKRIILNRSERH
jgi:hypothetical protein